jgi:D-amino-acid dehydrogenase
MKVIVLGAGVVGIASAWYLRQAGHEVTVVDRQFAPGLETSFANGGQISVSHAEPWANPHAIAQILRWLGREDAPLLFRLRADTAQWRWGARFLIECLPWRTRHNIAAILRLALFSRAALKALRSDTGIEYDHAERGILHFYTEPAQFELAQSAVRVMAEFGCQRLIKTPQELLAIEPALGHALPRIVGGDHAVEDESGDACTFTQRLAARCADAGVVLRTNVTVRAIDAVGGAVSGVQIVDAVHGPSTLTADAYVVALGSHSPRLLRPLGLNPPIYPVKGYSLTIPVADSDAAPRVSLTDDEHKLVFSRLGQRLRVAGTAELNGYNNSLNAVRCAAILKRVEDLFPRAGDFRGATRWCGLRPATPSNLPCIGATRYRNLFLNSGHGTLGWTLACGSGRLLADLVSGRAPGVDPAPYALMR